MFQWHGNEVVKLNISFTLKSCHIIFRVQSQFISSDSICRIKNQGCGYAFTMEVNTRIFFYIVIIQIQYKLILINIYSIKNIFCCFFYIYFNLLHLYSAFLGTQSALHSKRESPRPPPMCSIHLDDATAAIVHQNDHHTPAYWWRGDRVMKQSVYGDDLEAMMVRDQWASLTRMPGLHPYSFLKDILGFLMTTESQDLGLTSHPKEGFMDLL